MKIRQAFKSNKDEVHSVFPKLPDFVSYFSFTRKLCATIGLQPFTVELGGSGKWYLRFLTFFGILMTLNQLFIVVCFTTFLLYDARNPLEAVAHVPFLVFVLESLSRFYFLTFKHPKINALIGEFQKLYDTPWMCAKRVVFTEELIVQRKRLIMYQFAHVFCNGVFTYAPLCITVILLSCCSNILPNPLFILNTWMPFDKFRYAWMTYIVEINVCRYAQYVTVSTDCIMIMMLIQLNYHFDCLGHEIITVVKEINRKRLKGKLRHELKMHNKLIDLCQELNSTFLTQLFVKFANASILICTIGFVTIASDDLLITVQFLMFLSANILQIYVLSLYGDQLMEKSSSVGMRAYESDWYYCNVQDMKAISLIILRSHKPCFISIANVAYVQKETFKEIMTAAYTYTSLLKKLYN